MSAFFPLKALTGGVFSYLQIDRRTLVLRAYFDDSGTHGGADAIVMGGLIADEADWDRIEPEWRRALDFFGISKMHMSHCERGEKEFAGWDRDRRDRAIKAFRSIIEKLNGRMIASAVSREVWAASAAPNILGEIWQQPINYLFNDAMRRALESRRSSGPAREPVAIMFDCRQENLDFWGANAGYYAKRHPDKVAAFAFGNMEKILPLQAADMIAYETFVFQCARERIGAEPTPRPNFASLLENVSGSMGFFTETQLLDHAQRISVALDSSTVDRAPPHPL